MFKYDYSNLLHEFKYRGNSYMIWPSSEYNLTLHKIVVCNSQYFFVDSLWTHCVSFTLSALLYVFHYFSLHNKHSGIFMSDKETATWDIGKAFAKHKVNCHFWCRTDNGLRFSLKFTFTAGLKADYRLQPLNRTLGTSRYKIQSNLSRLNDIFLTTLVTQHQRWWRPWITNSRQKY